MPQASISAFARSRDLEPDGDGLRHAAAPGERLPNAAAAIAIDAIKRHIDGTGGGVPVVTKSPPQICGDVSCPVPPICPGGSAVGVNIIVDVIVTGIYVF